MPVEIAHSPSQIIQLTVMIEKSPIRSDFGQSSFYTKGHLGNKAELRRQVFKLPIRPNDMI